MDNDGILREIRRRVGDVDGILDPAEIDQSNIFWYQYMDSANVHLAATNIITATYIVNSGTGISPDTTIIDGLLIATWSVAHYLSADVSTKVRSGELGIRFKSGQDELSTVEAAKKIESAADRAEKEFRAYVNIKLADPGGILAASRAQ